MALLATVTEFSIKASFFLILSSVPSLYMKPRLFTVVIILYPLDCLYIEACTTTTPFIESCERSLKIPSSIPPTPLPST